MAEYVPNDPAWVDDDGSGTTGTTFTAARMNHIEDGIRDASLQGPWKPVVATRSVNLNVAAAPGPNLAVDGGLLDGSTGGRVLLLGQTDPSQNGIWRYFYNGFSGASSMTREPDNTLPAHFWQGREVMILNGPYNNEQRFTYVGFDGAAPGAGDPITFHPSVSSVGKAFAFLMAG